MNIKFIIILLTCTSFDLHAQQNQSAPGQQMANSVAVCTDLAKAMSNSTNPKAAVDPKSCAVLSKASALNGHSFIMGTPEAPVVSADRTISCRMVAGYTLDFKSCVSGVKTYDAIRVAEKALDAQAQVRTDLKFKQITEETNARAAQGDTQGAAIDASIDQNNHLKQMNQERAGAYSLAVGAMATSLSVWQSKKPAKIQKACEEKNPKSKDYFGDVSCAEMAKVLTEEYESEAFANGQAKGQLTMALTEFIAKGVKAGIVANSFKNISKQLEDYKGDIPFEESQLDKCALNPMQKECIGRGQRVAIGSGQNGDFSMGDIGSNDFNVGEGGDVLEDQGNATTLSGLQTLVPESTSPFRDDAKIANDILNPAPAGSAGPGGGGAGGGGGGGGGLGGGGGASLGRDLKGDDGANKENDIKAKKVSNSYVTGGGKGFTALKGSNEKEEDTFSSLFDSKSNGNSIEEDRSIASGDPNGVDSGLFQKISKRYGQVQAQNRLLEEK